MVRSGSVSSPRMTSSLAACAGVRVGGRARLAARMSYTCHMMGGEGWWACAVGRVIGGEGGGRVACAAHIVWSALLLEYVDAKPLLKVICDSGSRGGAGQEAWHRWGDSHPGVLRAWTHPEALGRARG